MIRSEIRTLTILLFITFYTGYAYADELGFDEICNIYTEVLNSSMSEKDSNHYVSNNVSKRINNKDAITTHSIIYQVEASKRYEIFKESAEDSLKQNWDCSAMKKLMK